ncbi:MAG: hypothetical protein GX089_12535 [Fibrobacter sp.]|jgi:hypothetical protein|nr:hypothetical protein [Fibrobacter sp.]HON11503.1 hypothetical protein [Chitinispirillaceae bacterium]
MKIFPSFRGYDSTATAYAKTNSSYAPDSSMPQSVAKLYQTIAVDKLRCSFNAGNLFIKLPKNGKINRIRIYSLSGKLLADFDPAV